MPCRVNDLKPGRCKWILVGASAPSGDPLMRREALYCGEPTKYHNVAQDDGTRKREHLTFCPEHQAKAEAESEVF